MDPIVPRSCASRCRCGSRSAPTWIKYGAARRRARLLPRHQGHRRIYRYVEPFWMFGLFGTTGDVDRRSRVLLARDGVRAQPLLPVPVPGRRGARHDLEADQVLPHQALVRVQHLQDLREDLRVGRDPRAEDRQDASACAATTASGSTWTRRSARTGSSCIAADKAARSIGSDVICVELESADLRICNDSMRDRLNPRFTAHPSAARCSSNRSFNPDDTSTSFFAVTITAFDVRQPLDQRHPLDRPEDEHAFREPRRRAPGWRRRSSRCGSRAPAGRSPGRGCGDSGAPSFMKKRS